MSDVIARRDDLPAEMTEHSESRSTELGEFTVEFGSTRAGFAMGPELFEGLPENTCACPHWGVLLKGASRPSAPVTELRRTYEVVARNMAHAHETP